MKHRFALLCFFYRRARRAVCVPEGGHAFDSWAFRKERLESS